MRCRKRLRFYRATAQVSTTAWPEGISSTLRLVGRKLTDLYCIRRLKPMVSAYAGRKHFSDRSVSFGCSSVIAR
jgi:hypothetical protein